MTPAGAKRAACLVVSLLVATACGATDDPEGGSVDCNALQKFDSSLEEFTNSKERSFSTAARNQAEALASAADGAKVQTQNAEMQSTLSNLASAVRELVQSASGTDEPKLRKATASYLAAVESYRQLESRHCDSKPR